MWIAILRQEAAYHVGKQGQNIMLIPYATCETKDDLKSVINEYYRGYAEAANAERPDIAVALHTYVSESLASARAEAEEALKRYVRSRLYAKRRSYDELETAGLILFGDAEQVSSRIRELEAAGMNHLMILVDFGALQAERVRASLQRFVREVMPNFVESGSISAS
jgi:alkanesulfonate monooxygenase SsuD/methylene tetrahydromethanopterin reductase-like flavin-dependent oxidoreductase (luciferase family)